jgi:hypothetical protein
MPVCTDTFDPDSPVSVTKHNKSSVGKREQYLNEIFYQQALSEVEASQEKDEERAKPPEADPRSKVIGKNQSLKVLFSCFH